ncbi:MAG: hypothetical protein LBL00_07130 [Endomicrobium sp.]|nr:hypothetical protein [Endomicrobium sp.]
MSEKKAPQFNFFAALFCIFFFVFLLFSTAFIVTHSNHEHDCDGCNGGCAECEYIMDAAVNFLKQFCQPLTVYAFIAACLFFAVFLSKIFSFNPVCATPVSLKVRLNN